MFKRFGNVGGKQLRLIGGWLIAIGFVAAAQGADPVRQISEIEPRLWSADFHSQVLGRDMRFLVILPETVTRDATDPVPVIYILHGRGRNETTLLTDAFTRRTLMSSRCAIVLPRGEDGWYVNSPVVPADRYADYLDEVMSLARDNFPIQRDGAGQAVTGWSMGGYGAAYTFARLHGDFAALATIIGIIDYPREEIRPAELNYPVQPRFGIDPKVWILLNPRRMLVSAARKPVLVAYADRAPERQMNAVFMGEARRLGFPVRELRMPGEHVFAVVREAMPAVIGFLELQLLPPTPIPPP